MNHPGVERGLRAKKRPDGFGGNIPAAREGDVWMKRAQVGLEPRVDGGFLHTFVQLKKMRMAGADPNPKNVRAPFAGKGAEARNGKEERFPRDDFQILLERLFHIARNVAEKTEGQMHLLRREPSDPAQVRIQLRETLGDGVRKGDADKEPFRAHSWPFNSQPERDALPSGPPGCGSTVLIIFIMFPLMFGNSALPRIVARAINGIARDGKPRRHAERI